MLGPFKQLDLLLRGALTQPRQLLGGEFPVRLRAMVFVVILLGAFHGAFVGSYSCLNRVEPEFRQPLASMAKIPALLLLTLAVTGPSLYVFNALAGSPLSFLSLLRMLVGGMAVVTAVLASFATIIGFFAVTASSYPFMVLLNVVAASVAGLIGLTFLVRTLQRLADAAAAPKPIEENEALAVEAPAAAEASPVRTVFAVWMVAFALVGAQMAWVLRPFVGDPNRPFEWFRERKGNFFEAVFGVVMQLLGWR